MNLTLPPSKQFREDINIFKEKLEDGENFSFSKYADGEWAVLKNGSINNTEFWFDKDSVVDTMKREKLIDSFRFQHPQYYVGISCPCCQGQHAFEEMRDFSEQHPSRLTWANIWVNDNYKYYLSEIIPIFSRRNVVLYCNENSKLNELPFGPKKYFPISNNAWGGNWDLIEKSKEYITDFKVKDNLFLFCCGPFGNILCHELTKFDPDNTYLDIGSTLNPWLETGFDRQYYVQGSPWSNMKCVWGE
jgi:hypothetical protein